MTLSLVFGANVAPTGDPAQGPVQLTRHAERAGLDLVTIQDHPYQPAFFDAWTLLTYLAARTERITVVPTVASLPLRPPAVLAKAAATLDRLTADRVRLGLGAGAFWDPIVAMGGPRRTPREAVDALEEAVAVIRAMWSGERTVRVRGEHYRLAGTHPDRSRARRWASDPKMTGDRRPGPGRPPQDLQRRRPDHHPHGIGLRRTRRAVGRPVGRGRGRGRHERIRLLAGRGPRTADHDLR